MHTRTRTLRLFTLKSHTQCIQAVKRQEELSAQLESAGDDMGKMQAILDELDKLNNKVRLNSCGTTTFGACTPSRGTEHPLRADS